ncbi:hypothetical protein TREMEDRAFT_57648 [Tremella mesenterica DSM 1558]|uniref:uncharacterized protein n=1 Tax=Tremella mesenterica (strain ATCC 24925 / CBS 8224 / DSM 1558 / NBRC 9311 / NRRL Y-6157 / RJB 2259-6 / UBC 559-6) TaxID=578456 RepID=UPI0003F49F49|nr:uncharacterized protein TREMEDRAFT_57648 [Tremella mesenterica DSM 1558]EIW67101.1 hypothetical protein TREMEDRAFT_57648 [Tremella mesenterica DSM 1558]
MASNDMTNSGMRSNMTLINNGNDKEQIMKCLWESCYFPMGVVGGNGEEIEKEDVFVVQLGQEREGAILLVSVSTVHSC